MKYGMRSSNWISIYTVITNQLLVYQGTVFGDSFLKMASEHNVRVQTTVNDSHSILGWNNTTNRYGRYLRNFSSNPRSLNNNLGLSVYLKGITDTCGVEGFVTSARVFWELSPDFMKSQPKNVHQKVYDRALIGQMACFEMDNKVAGIKYICATMHVLRPGIEDIYAGADQVLVWF